MMLPNVDECWQFKDLFELYDSRQCAPQICYLILKQMNKLNTFHSMHQQKGCIWASV